MQTSGGREAWKIRPRGKHKPADQFLMTNHHVPGEFQGDVQGSLPFKGDRALAIQEDWG